MKESSSSGRVPLTAMGQGAAMWAFRFEIHKHSCHIEKCLHAYACFISEILLDGTMMSCSIFHSITQYKEPWCHTRGDQSRRRIHIHVWKLYSSQRAVHSTGFILSCTSIHIIRSFIIKLFDIWQSSILKSWICSKTVTFGVSKWSKFRIQL